MSKVPAQSRDFVFIFLFIPIMNQPKSDRENLKNSQLFTALANSKHATYCLNINES